MSAPIRVLILSTFPHGRLSFELKNLKKQYHIFAYQIDRYLKSHGNGQFLVIHAQMPERGKSERIVNSVEYRCFKCPQTDFTIVCESRGVFYRPDKFFNIIREKTSKGIMTFCASNVELGKEDVLFYMVPSGRRNRRRCKLLNWTADDILCSPKQNPFKLRILIDHNYYGPHIRMLNNDLTVELTNQVCKFVKEKREQGMDIEVRRFITGGIETVDIDNPQEMIQYVQGSGLSYSEVCEEYSKTDIFIVTHMECMGLSVLESAMSGALILAPKGYIKHELIRDLNHIQFERYINWEHVMNKLDYAESRRRAKCFSWSNNIQKIIDVMVNYDEYLKNDLRFHNNHSQKNQEIREQKPLPLKTSI